MSALLMIMSLLLASDLIASLSSFDKLSVVKSVWSNICTFVVSRYCVSVGWSGLIVHDAFLNFVNLGVAPVGSLVWWACQRCVFYS